MRGLVLGLSPAGVWLGYGIPHDWLCGIAVAYRDGAVSSYAYLVDRSDRLNPKDEKEESAWMLTQLPQSEL